MTTFKLILCLFSPFLALHVHGVVLVNGATDALGDEWTPITFGAIEATGDLGDNGATGGGVENGLVGSSTLSSFYTNFDDNGSSSLTDGTLFFRFRIGGDESRSRANRTGVYDGQAFVGLDVSGDGALDLYVGAGDGNVTLRTAGGASNVGPNTIDLSNAPTSTIPFGSNFDFSVVSDIDTGLSAADQDLNNGDGEDLFVSFSIDFALIAAAAGPSFDDTSGIGYVAFTSNDGSGLRDIAGVDGEVGSTTVFGDPSLEAFGGPVDAFGNPVAVPEPSSYALLMGLSMGMVVFVRSRRRAE